MIGEIVAGLALTVAALIETESNGSLRRSIGIVSLAIIGIAIVGSGLNAGLVHGNLDWVQTFNAHFGPALRVLQGGVPMVDVFSQYGLLPYLLFSLAFVTVLSPSYPAAAFVVSFVNAAYIAVAAIVLVRAMRSKLLVAATIVILTVIVVPEWRGIPASGALRFLPPLLVCFGLTLQPDRHISPIALACLVIASFWSFEGLAWGAAVLFGTVGLRLIYERALLPQWVYGLGVPAAVVALAHLAFSVLWLTLFDSWPRYDIYLELLTSYGGNGWSDVPFPGVKSPLWICCTSAYVINIGWAFIEAWKGKAKGENPTVVNVAFPIAVAGLAGFSYWIARPLDFNLLPTLVPAVMLVSITIDRLCTFSLSVFKYYRFGRLIAALSTIAFVPLFAFAYTAGTQSVRTDFATYAKSKIAEISRLETTPKQDAYYDPVIADAARLIEKYQPDGKTVTLFVRLPRDVAVYLLTNKSDVFGRSNQNDERSRTLYNDDLERGRSAIKLGSYVFAESVLPDFASESVLPTSLTDTFTPFDCQAYYDILHRFDLCVIDSSPSGVMAMLVKAKPAQCRRFGHETAIAGAKICKGHEWLKLPSWATKP